MKSKCFQVLASFRRDLLYEVDIGMTYQGLNARKAGV